MCALVERRASHCERARARVWRAPREVRREGACSSRERRERVDAAVEASGVRGETGHDTNCPAQQTELHVIVVGHGMHISCDVEAEHQMARRHARGRQKAWRQGHERHGASRMCSVEEDGSAVLECAESEGMLMHTCMWGILLCGDASSVGRLRR